MKKFIVILLIIGLASMLYASTISVSKAKTLAKEHARQDVRKLGTLFLGVLFPVLTPVVSFLRNYSVPNERLVYIESLANNPNIISTYIENYKRTRKGSATLWGLGGTLINFGLFLGFYNVN
ncbi:MAG: hypothetical protein R6U52_08185 [Kosmotogaceae bacterium]